MDDRDVRLEAVLDWLEQHRITTDQAVKRVADMKFTDPQEDLSPHAEQAADALGDLPVPEPGSAFPIAAAHAEGRIDDAQYKALAEAAAQATEKVLGA